jgi:ActD protein
MPGDKDGLNNTRYVAAVFRNEKDLFSAVVETRRAGFQIHDVYTPFPVHGMDQAAGLKRSRLTWIAFIAGAIGLMFGLGLQVWTSAYDWPLNVGGKPFNSFPLFIPVTFELTVLFSGLIAISVLLVRNRLWLFSKRMVFSRVTDDRFVMVLKQSDASFDQQRAVNLFARHGALKVIEGDQFV